MKRLLFLYWDSCFCCIDMLEAMADWRDEHGGLEVSIVDMQDPDTMEEEALIRLLRERIARASSDTLFSFGYFPLISQLCEEEGIQYISWIYDSPVVNLYDPTVRNRCNRIFLFDSQMADELHAQGIAHAWYLPMAVNPRRLGEFLPGEEERARYEAQLSFVGSMYTERYNFYDEMAVQLDAYSRGYLEGLLRAQSAVYGAYILDQSLPTALLKKMEEVYPLHLRRRTEIAPARLYADYVLARKLTAIERAEIVMELGGRYPLKLYTGEQSFTAAGVANMGEIDYFHKMPYVFRCSRINLNISLRSIRSGIPLRAFDIMGCGGFLLTNYQEDLLRHFTPGEDLVYWDDRADIPDIVEYYLSHDEERQEIAENGRRKVCTEHTFRLRFEEMLDVLDAE